MGDDGRFRVAPEKCGVQRLDPGFVYVIEAHGRFKIGRTTDAEARLRAAETWLPDMKLVGLKPFWSHTHVEQTLHLGFGQYWYAKEWFELPGDGLRELLVEGFSEFSDTDRDRNSVDFVYWVNSSGLAELTLEYSQQPTSKRKFLQAESGRPLAPRRKK